MDIVFVGRAKTTVKESSVMVGIPTYKSDFRVFVWKSIRKSVSVVSWRMGYDFWSLMTKFYLDGCGHSYLKPEIKRLVMMVFWA